MTTFILPATTTTFAPDGSVASVAPTEFRITMLNGDTTIDYVVLFSDPEEIEIALDFTNIGAISRDGVTLLDPFAYDISLTEVSWGGGNTTLAFNVFDYTTGESLLGEVAGAPLPSFATASDVNAFLASVTGLSSAIRPGFQAGDEIELSTLPGVTVTEDDLIGGTDFSDVLGGGAGDDLIFGGKGADLINGDGGADTLRGNNGQDTINGNAGADEMYGGTRGDVMSGGSEDDRIVGQRGNDTLYGGSGEDVLNGGGGGDQLFAGSGNDYLKGGSKADLMVGQAGNDRLFGNGGADTLEGRSDDDTINAGGDDDVLIGGTGDDFLKGGSGGDTFVFEDGDGADRIVDFELGTDALSFTSAQVGGAATGAAVVSTYASVVNGQVVFDFGGGDSVTLLNVGSLSGLDSDIIIV